MDERVRPTSSRSSSSPASFFPNAGHHQELEFVSCEVLEEWLGGDDGLEEPWNGAAWAKGVSHSAGNDLSGEPPAPAAKRRGRKPGVRTDGPAIGHLEAERQRRDKLNRLFCELRAAVPTVSRMDKTSLLADATSYIADLRGHVEQLEAKARQGAPSAATASASHPFLGLEVRMVGREAVALRLTSAARHAPARLMDALRSLDLPVQHACVCRLGDVTVQDAVVDVSAAALRDEGGLRTALLHRLQLSG